MYLKSVESRSQAVSPCTYTKSSERIKCVNYLRRWTCSLPSSWHSLYNVYYAPNHHIHFKYINYIRQLFLKKVLKDKQKRKAAVVMGMLLYSLILVSSIYKTGMHLYLPHRTVTIEWNHASKMPSIVPDSTKLSFHWHSFVTELRGDKMRKRYSPVITQVEITGLSTVLWEHRKERTPSGEWRMFQQGNSIF